MAFAAAEGVRLRVDGTEVQVRRPGANKAGRRAFVSGKKKQNTITPTAISEEKGRLLWLGAMRPGPDARCTALRTGGIEDLPHHHPDVAVDVDSGYQGPARDFPGQVSGPPKKPAKDTPPEDVARREAARKDQSSQRICVEHAIAEPKQWRPLQRYIGRREYFEQTALTIAGLVSDRCAMR
jgi:DDE superfamily endonuclease